MNERIAQFRVGVMVLATGIITVILMLLFGRFPRLGQPTYTVQLRFDNAPGVTRDTPVRKSGVLVGRVTDVALRDGGGVVVTAAIHSNIKLRRNEVPRIDGSLLGDATVQFVQLPDDGEPAERRPDAVVREGETIEGEAASGILQTVNDPAIQELITSMTQTSKSVDRLARKLTDLVEDNDEKFTGIVDKLDGALDSLQQAAENANEILGDDELRADLKRTLADLPKTFSQAEDAFSEMKDTFNRMEGTLDLADQNLRNLQDFTKPLSKRGQDFFEKIDLGAKKIDVLLDQLLSFTDALNTEEGSLGRFLHDPELYDNLNDAVANIDELTRDLKPIVSDARIFSDKLAREGLHGVFKQSSGVKWLGQRR